MQSILIVDDSPENISSLKSILEKEYKIYAAVSGETALTIMLKILPDIVLLDVVMPEVSGVDVLKLMKQDNDLKYIPVIFVTGHDDKESEKEGIAYGAVDFIRKPYNPEIVSLKIKNHLTNKIYRDELEKTVKERTAELAASQQAVIMGMSLLAEGRDNETGNHIKRIQVYTEILTHYIQHKNPEILTKHDAESIIMYAPLHDIGKVSIPDNILLKKGKFTQEEFEIMQSHTELGAQVLKKTNSMIKSSIDYKKINKPEESILSKLQDEVIEKEEKDTEEVIHKHLEIAIEICEFHHEKYDGSGYPRGLKGEQIPISARIVALADIYDALTSERPYKKAFSHQQAYKIITEGDGRTMPGHFSPEVIDAFNAVHKDFEKVMKEFKIDD